MFNLLSMTDLPPEENAGETETPVFFTDLNLDQILDRVCDGWDAGVRKLYERFPATKEDEDYRRAIYSDIRNDAIHAAMTEYYSHIRERAVFAKRRDDAYEPVQKEVWYLRECHAYITSLEALHNALKSTQPRSAGIKAFSNFLSGCVSEERYLRLKAEAELLWAELSSFRVILSYEKNRFTLAEGKGEGGYEQFLTECFPGESRDLKSPFIDTEYYSRLEEEIVKLFRKKHKAFFKRLDLFCSAYPSFIHEGIPALEAQMAYYLAYASFQRMMETKGFHMCTPRPSEDTLRASKLYDLALALTNMASGKEVVPNEAELGADENFFVLTGPNQGGKTTYGRSLGQLIYFTKMGLDVPAETAEVPRYSNLWTHFSVEESVETGRGKLMDELVRLKPVMEEEQEGAFIVINELFTTAANYDAIEMGKRVLEYLIGRHCKGIYVTHLGELSRSCKGVVSLRASVNENHIQTYRIERSEAFEADGTNRLVLKYKLTYEQIRERFS